MLRVPREFCGPTSRLSVTPDDLSVSLTLTHTPLTLSGLSFPLCFCIYLPFTSFSSHIPHTSEHWRRDNAVSTRGNPVGQTLLRYCTRPAAVRCSTVGEGRVLELASINTKIRVSRHFPPNTRLSRHARGSAGSGSNVRARLRSYVTPYTTIRARYAARGAARRDVAAVKSAL